MTITASAFSFDLFAHLLIYSYFIADRSLGDSSDGGRVSGSQVHHGTFDSETGRGKYIWHTVDDSHFAIRSSLFVLFGSSFQWAQMMDRPAEDLVSGDNNNMSNPHSYNGNSGGGNFSVPF